MFRGDDKAHDWIHVSDVSSARIMSAIVCSTWQAGQSATSAKRELESARKEMLDFKYRLEEATASVAALQRDVAEVKGPD